MTWELLLVSVRACVRAWYKSRFTLDFAIFEAHSQYPTDKRLYRDLQFRSLFPVTLQTGFLVVDHARVNLPRRGDIQGTDALQVAVAGRKDEVKGTAQREDDARGKTVRQPNSK